MLSSISCVDMMTSDQSSGGTSGTATVPTKPLLFAPANLAVGIYTPPTLVWQAISNATSYTVQIAKDSQFKNIVTTKTITTSATYVALGLVNNTTYYWRVCSNNSTGSSEYSTAYSFTTVNITPLLLTPYNGATNQSRMPVLVWETVTGAVNYTVEVTTSSTFAYITLTRTYVVPSTLLITGLLANTTYYWRVRAIFSSSTSNNSNPFHFTTGS